MRSSTLVSKFLIMIGLMAESEGFEPPVPFRVRLISSQVHSTGLCQLSVVLQAGYFSNFNTAITAWPTHPSLCDALFH
jgi:hypothetical protein